MLFKHHAHLFLFLLPCLSTPPLHADDLPELICENRTLEVDAKTGNIQFIPPTNSGTEDCSKIGAASVDLDPNWRQKLPPQLRWKQQANALSLCHEASTPLGQIVKVLPEQGCVLLQTGKACTIVTAQAISHAQLANAVRSCVP